MLQQSCAPGLLWSDADGGMCDFADNVSCKKRHRKRHAVYFGEKNYSVTFLTKNLATERLLIIEHRFMDFIFSGTKTVDVESECEGNEHHPYPGDCTQYLLCQWGRLEAASCAPGIVTFLLAILSRYVTEFSTLY